MKWTENGILHEGTVEEYRALHDGGRSQPRRTRAGRLVTVLSDGNPLHFRTIKEAAAWITNQTGKYLSASALGKALDRDGNVSLDRFAPASLFAPIENTTQGGELPPENPQQEGEEHE